MTDQQELDRLRNALASSVETVKCLLQEKKGITAELATTKATVEELKRDLRMESLNVENHTKAVKYEYQRAEEAETDRDRLTAENEKLATALKDIVDGETIQEVYDAREFARALLNEREPKPQCQSFKYGEQCQREAGHEGEHQATREAQTFTWV